MFTKLSWKTSDARPKTCICNCINRVHNCEDHSTSFDFISAVLIWFISYTSITSSHLLHRNIWTHNWPAPTMSGFIAQLVGASHRYRLVEGSNPVEVLNFLRFLHIRNCINYLHNCEDHSTFEAFSTKWQTILSDRDFQYPLIPNSFPGLFSLENTGTAPGTRLNWNELPRSSVTGRTDHFFPFSLQQRTIYLACPLSLPFLSWNDHIS